jgi:protein-disulfide isomerase
MGTVGELPAVRSNPTNDEVKGFVEGFLPEALSQRMGLKSKVVWDVGPRRPGALIPMSLMIDTGYGEYRRPAAVTADGKYVVMATEMPREEDPVAHRRRLLANDKHVVWDTSDGSKAKVEIVEFSDLECPACKGKWPVIEDVLEKHPQDLRHGMVSFPLTMIHPWAFRAASASWCVGLQNAQALIPFKETFYSLQTEMEVSLVTQTSVDFVVGNGLDESAFRGCYLRQPSLEAVHKQMGLGQVMGVRATPTYFVNGWQIQVPDASWFPAFIADLVAGKDPM